MKIKKKLFYFPDIMCIFPAILFKSNVPWILHASLGRSGMTSLYLKYNKIYWENISRNISIVHQKLTLVPEWLVMIRTKTKDLNAMNDNRFLFPRKYSWCSDAHVVDLATSRTKSLPYQFSGLSEYLGLCCPWHQPQSNCTASPLLCQCWV